MIERGRANGTHIHGSSLRLIGSIHSDWFISSLHVRVLSPTKIVLLVSIMQKSQPLPVGFGPSSFNSSPPVLHFMMIRLIQPTVRSHKLVAQVGIGTQGAGWFSVALYSRFVGALYPKLGEPTLLKKSNESNLLKMVVPGSVLTDISKYPTCDGACRRSSKVFPDFQRFLCRALFFYHSKSE